MTDKEKRALERIRLTITLPVLDREAEKIIGELEDITTEGVRLICNDELQAGEVYELAMELPPDFDEGRTISFIARCVWCNINDTINLYHAGLQFEKKDTGSDMTIGRLIERYSAG